MVGLLNEIANCIGNMLKAISRLLHKLHCILCTVTNKIPVRGWGGGGGAKGKEIYSGPAPSQIGRSSSG